MGDKYQVTIDIEGCDDTTSFDIWVTAEEHDLLKRVGAISETTSTYGCMPVMKVNYKEYGKS